MKGNKGIYIFGGIIVLLATYCLVVKLLIHGDYFWEPWLRK